MAFKGFKMNCSHINQSGGVISWCGLKSDYCGLNINYWDKCKDFNKKTETTLEHAEFKDLAQTSILSVLNDDGKYLTNEALDLKERLKHLKKSRETRLMQNYKEKRYDDLINDIYEHTDDLFDSKGDDITEKDFLENEMWQ